MGRPGRPRKVGAKRHPDGSVVRQVWAHGRRFALSLFERDETRAKRDPREGTVAGRLELLTTPKGGITRLERLAGERFAEVLTAWRRQCGMCPNPNAPAANLEIGTTGKASSGDCELTDAEQYRLLGIEDRYRTVKKLIAHRNKDNPTLRDRRLGQKIWDILEAIFVFDQDVIKEQVALVRKHGLKPLVFHFGLTGREGED